MDDIDIRPVAVDERRAVTNTVRTALLSGPTTDEVFEAGQASWDGTTSFAAWAGDRCVGHVAAFPFDSTVPGGDRVPIAAVTRVGVLPTHTRRGLLTRMMDRLLREAHAAGTPIATLIASETPIYRRFGFGLATETVSMSLTTRDATPWRIPAGPGSMRLLEQHDVLATVPDVYERAARWHVGSISRPDWYWPRLLADATQPTSRLHDKGAFVAVHTGADGTDDGYVHYVVQWEDGFANNPTGVGTVRDLWGSSPQVELDLWRYLLGIDLITTWRAEPRPVDEPVRHALHDLRAYRTQARIDDQWVRLLDVDAALSARAYGPAGDAVVIAVHDPMFDTNCATWSVSRSGAQRSSAPADVEVGIAGLSAAYLGGVSWHDLAISGEIPPHTPTDVLDRADALFVTGIAPFCGSMY